MTPKTFPKYIAKIKKLYAEQGWSVQQYEAALDYLTKELEKEHQAQKFTGSEYKEALVKIGNALNKPGLNGKQVSAGSSSQPLLSDAQMKAMITGLDAKPKKGQQAAPAQTVPDPGQQAVNDAEAKLEKELKKIYGAAAKEIRAELLKMQKEYGPKLAEMQAALGAGEITQEEYNKWATLQLVRQKAVQGKLDQLTGVMLHANEKAAGMINGQQLGVFAENANYQEYQLTQAAKMNLMFSVYDENTAEKLIRTKPELLPRKIVNGKKDKAWNKTKIANAVARAVIQGDSIPKLAKRVAEETASTNMSAMIRYARTAMTAAQNSGRMEGMHQAQAMGIKMKKVWMATLDKRTRDTHAALDGVAVGVDEKFPNGLMYPGDPEGPAGEVWNCRCTLVYDYEGFPKDAAAQRIQYDEYVATETDKNGKEKKVYHRDSSLITDMPYKEWKAAKEGSLLNDLSLAKTNLAEAQKDVVKKKINEAKVYSGIWKDDVTLADYPAKKASIQAKRDYYDTEIDKLKQAMADGHGWATPEKLKDLESRKKLLAEYEKNGKALEKRDAALKAVQDIYNQIGYQTQASAPAVMQTKAKKAAKQASSAAGGANAGTAAQTAAQAAVSGAGNPFGPDAYTKERRDAARWTTDQAAIDKVMRPLTEQAWQNASTQEKDAAYEYTVSYHKFNEPLRGIEYGTNAYKGVGNTTLNPRNNGPYLDALTDLIDRCRSDHDMWMQRGCRRDGMDKFLQVPDSLFDRSEKEIEQALLGKSVTEYAFMSCGSSKGKGFTGRPFMFYIYAPKGTKMLYLEPFSGYGNGSKRGWDGKQKQRTYSTEFETLLQQGTQFRVTRVRKVQGTILVDLEVIDQSKQQRWKKKP